MYAVIATGGKQYRVAEGDVLRLEKLLAEPGAAVEFDKVLVVGQGADLKVGKPYVAGSKVTATSSAAASTTCGRARTASPTPK